MACDCIPQAPDKVRKEQSSGHNLSLFTLEIWVAFCPQGVLSLRRDLVTVEHSASVNTNLTLCNLRLKRVSESRTCDSDHRLLPLRGTFFTLLTTCQHSPGTAFLPPFCALDSAKRHCAVLGPRLNHAAPLYSGSPASPVPRDSVSGTCTAAAYPWLPLEGCSESNILLSS